MRKLFSGIDPRQVTRRAFELFAENAQVYPGPTVKRGAESVETPEKWRTEGIIDMRALAFAGGVVLLVLAYYVSISDFARQFGMWGGVLAAVCSVVFIRGTTRWMYFISLVGMVIGIAAFAGQTAVDLLL